jgi:hypothetical protein
MTASMGDGAVDRDEADAPARPRGAIGLLVAVGPVLVVALVVALVTALVLAGGRDDDGSASPPASTTAPGPRRAGACADLDQAALEAALGGPTEVAVTDARRCRLERPGTLLAVDVEQLDDGADRQDLDAIELQGGADGSEPWPEVEVDDVGDAATWIADPGSDGAIGELYVRRGSHLVRVAVSTPPDYRREARVIGIALAEVVVAGL